MARQQALWQHPWQSSPQSHGMMICLHLRKKGKGKRAATSSSSNGAPTLLPLLRPRRPSLSSSNNSSNSKCSKRASVPAQKGRPLSTRGQQGQGQGLQPLGVGPAA